MTIFEDLGNHLTSTSADAFTLCGGSGPHFLFFTSRGANLAASARPREIQPFIINGL